MVNWFESVMNFFVAFFIITTGVILISQVSEVSSSNALLYSLSILFSGSYFMYRAASGLIMEDKNETKNKEKNKTSL